MRRRLRIVPALTLLVCGCGQVADHRSNVLAELSLPADYDPLAPLAVDLTLEGGRCRAAVAGEALDGERLVQRATRTLETSIRFLEAERGSAEALPPAIIRTAPDLPWRCVAGATYHLQQTGFGRLAFELRTGASVSLDAPLFDGPNAGPRPVKALVIAADGSLVFDGVRLIPDSLNDALRAYARARPRAVLAIVPAAQTRIDTVVALLVRAREAGAELTSSDPMGLGWVAFDEAGDFAQWEALEAYAGELK